MSRFRTERVPILTLVLDQSIQVRERLDQDMVARYAEAESLPPILVVEDGHDLVVGDGFHRVAAAKKRGDETILSEIVRGNRFDAYELACRHNSRHGKSLTTAERNAAMLRLRGEGKTAAEVAEIFGVSRSRVSTSAPTHLTVTAPGTDIGRIRQATISKLPKTIREPIAEAAKKRGWDSQEIATAASFMKDRRVPQKFKDKMLAGDLDPFVVKDNGDVRILTQTIARGIRRSQKEGPRVALANVQSALGDLMTFEAEEIVASIEPGEFLMILKWIEQEDAFVSALLSTMRSQKRLAAVQ